MTDGFRITAVDVQPLNQWSSSLTVDVEVEPAAVEGMFQLFAQVLIPPGQGLGDGTFQAGRTYVDAPFLKDPAAPKTARITVPRCFIVWGRRYELALRPSYPRNWYPYVKVPFTMDQDWKAVPPGLAEVTNLSAGEVRPQIVEHDPAVTGVVEIAWDYDFGDAESAWFRYSAAGDVQLRYNQLIRRPGDVPLRADVLLTTGVRTIEIVPSDEDRSATGIIKRVVVENPYEATPEGRLIEQPGGAEIL